MQEFTKFLRENGPSIFTVVIVIFFLLTLFGILGITFTEPRPKDKYIEKVVTIETFTPNLDSFNPSVVCKEDETNTIFDIDKRCKKFSKDTCDIASCCKWINNKCRGSKM
jgi:hypothetical protein